MNHVDSFQIQCFRAIFCKGGGDWDIEGEEVYFQSDWDDHKRKYKCYKIDFRDPDAPRQYKGGRKSSRYGRDRSRSQSRGRRRKSHSRSYSRGRRRRSRSESRRPPRRSRSRTRTRSRSRSTRDRRSRSPGNKGN